MGSGWLQPARPYKGARKANSVVLPTSPADFDPRSEDDPEEAGN
jgi:hypothetical protein